MRKFAEDREGGDAWHLVASLDDPHVLRRGNGSARNIRAGDETVSEGAILIGRRDQGSEGHDS
jgi:hypothetical protein